MDPCNHPSNFMDLLTSQQSPECFPAHMGLGSSQVPQFSIQMNDDLDDALEEMPDGKRERRAWTTTEDIVLCSSWLNTSKDSVVGNDQKGKAFWKRICAYFNSSPKLVGFQNRESNHCKNRWQKINDSVSKFVGCYEAAKRLKSSGYNEDDVLKMAYTMYAQDYNKKFRLEHAWIELRNDQKWCSSLESKCDGSSKKRKLDDQTGSSNTSPHLDDSPMPRPEGVKAAKAKGKNKFPKSGTMEGETISVSEYQQMWAIKEKDLAMKHKLSKVGLLETLLAKKEPLTEIELALKTKLITDMLSN